MSFFVLLNNQMSSNEFDRILVLLQIVCCRPFCWILRFWSSWNLLFVVDKKTCIFKTHHFNGTFSLKNNMQVSTHWWFLCIYHAYSHSSLLSWDLWETAVRNHVTIYNVKLLLLQFRCQSPVVFLNGIIAEQGMIDVLELLFSLCGYYTAVVWKILGDMNSHIPLSEMGPNVSEDSHPKMKKGEQQRVKLRKRRSGFRYMTCVLRLQRSSECVEHKGREKR